MVTEALLTLRQTIVPLLQCVFLFKLTKSLKNSLSAEVAQQPNASGLPAAIFHWLTVKRHLFIASSLALIKLPSFATLRAVLAWDCHGNTQRRNKEEETVEGGREFLILWWGPASRNGCSADGNSLKWASTLSVSFNQMLLDDSRGLWGIGFGTVLGTSFFLHEHRLWLRICMDIYCSVCELICKSLKVSDRVRMMSGSRCMKQTLLGVLSDKMQITLET